MTLDWGYLWGYAWGYGMTDSLARKLSDAKARNAKPQDKAIKLSDGGGLYLLVLPTGAKLWRYKFRVGGREGTMALGAYPDVSLAAAREQHQVARSKVAAGENPVHDRKGKREAAAQQVRRDQAGKFDTVIDSWRETTDHGLAALTIVQRAREIAKYVEPAFKGKRVEQISRNEISWLLKRIEARAPEVARNVRNYLWGIFEHAIDIGLISANPVPPPRVLKRRVQKSHAAMSAARLPAFFAALHGCGANPETKAAARLVILTACRKAEATGARWSEFDLDAGEWTIPAERMKARREHWIPLSRQAVAMLRQLRATSSGEHLFPHRSRPNTPMAERTLNMLLRRNGFHGETIHGFRSVFSTHFNEQGASADVVERCLAHSPADKVRAAYNRHQYKDERRSMLQDWADYLDGLISKLNHLSVAA